MLLRKINNFFEFEYFDKQLFFSVIVLILIGLLMVASTSITISKPVYGESFKIFFKQLISVVIGFILAAALFKTSIKKIERISLKFSFIAIFLLILVLIPKLGIRVNGSIRWIGHGPIRIQISEIAKPMLIIYMSGYLVRKNFLLKEKASEIFKPLGIFIFAAFLLLKEPDFGAATVLMISCIGMIVMSDIATKKIVLGMLIGLIAFAFFAISSPYRLLRITSFLHPWNNKYTSGYQLTQALIAFGKGGVFGVGLGNSTQKLFYLPESHTDFIYAVLVEELGMIFGILIIAIFSLIICRILKIGKIAMLQKKYFQAYLCIGFGLQLAAEFIINLGVNVGILPTKGITLPYISYGGSSIIAMCCITAFILKISKDQNKHAMSVLNRAE